MSFAYQTAGQATGKTVSVDIGAQGNNRLVLIWVAIEDNTIGEVFAGDITVDGKACKQKIVEDIASGGGSHIELHTIDESELGNSNGSVTITFTESGTPIAGWGIHVQVWYGAKNDDVYSENENAIASGTVLNVTGINSLDGCLVSFGVVGGLSTGTFGSWTSPLTERTDGAPRPAGSNIATAGSVESTGQSAKTYSTTSSASTRIAGMVAVFEPAGITVDDVTSDKANGTYGVSEEIYICDEFSEQVDVSGTPQLDLAVKSGGRKVDYVANWTPGNLGSELEGWYDASDLSTITESAGLVSQLDDKSGNNLHLSQGTGSLQPQTDVEQINGLNVLEFIQDSMETSSNPFGTTIVDAHVFLVLRCPNPLNNGTAFSLSGGKGASNVSRWQSHCPYGTGNVYFDVGGTSGGNRLSEASGLAADEIAIMSFYSSDTDNEKELWKNGILLDSNAVGTSVAVIDNIVIGEDGDASSYQDMDVAEFIIINGTVSTSDRQKIEGYLAWKWGLVSSLPGAHPYKNRPPLVS